MDSRFFEMRCLESLSTGELAELADRSGLDIPPGLERVFIIGELLDLERAGSGPRGEGGEPEPEPGGLGELAALPERYGKPFVDVLIRDPLWAFAFWEAGGGEAGVFLRVVPLRGPDMRADVEAAFTVAVGAGDRSIYLGISREDGRCFRVDLCARRGDGSAVLASSRPFSLPRPADGRAGLGSPLARLSGAGRFPLVGAADRRPRRKGA